MKTKKLLFTLLKVKFLFLLSIACFDAKAQSATEANIGGANSVITISNNVTSVIDTGITLTANGSITGFTVSITGSYTNGDELGYTGSLPSGITAADFNTDTRSLVFSGTASAADWQALMRTVTLTTTSAICNPESRKVSFVVGIKYYNILNGHFYEYNNTGTDWLSAKAYASGTSYFGREGYLATLTSQAENSFTSVLLGQNSWIGCADNYLQINEAAGYSMYANQAASDGNFYWITGPERGTKISAQNAWSSGGVLPVNGVYNNWSSGEPNDYPDDFTPGEEDYGHIYTGSGLWNDFPNGQSIGSILEYGGMPDDNTTSKVVFTRNIYINGAPSGTITGGGVNVCPSSNSTTLTLTGLSGSVLFWESSLDNFLTDGTTITDTNISITLTNLDITTYFRATVYTLSGCSELPTSPTPIYVNNTIAGNIVAANNAICAGSTASFSLFGNSGSVVKWQVSTSSNFSSSVTDINNTSTSLAYSLGSAGTYYFRAAVQNGGCGSVLYTPGYTISVTSGTAPVGGSVSGAEHCGGSNSGTLTLTGYTGTIQKWQYSVDNGIIWTDVVNTTSTLSYSGVTSNRLYRVQISNGSCGNTYSSNGAIMVYGTTVSRWDGGTSSAWQISSNWCGGVADNGIDVVINSSAQNELVLDQSRIIGHLNFNHSNRKVTLGNNNLTVSGFINANNNNFIKTTGSGKVKINTGNATTVTLPIGNSSYNPLTVTNNTGSADYISARVFDNVYTTGYSGDTTRNGHVRHTWDIGKTNANSGAGLNFIFNWKSGEKVNIYSPALYHYNGTSWDEQSGPTSFTDTSLTYIGYTGTFSPFGIGNNLIPLSLSVMNFHAKANPESKSTLITWQTGYEKKSPNFDLQRSEDGIHWHSIGIVYANNNCSNLNKYEFRDNDPKAINYYRLSQLDADDRNLYTNIVRADFNFPENNTITLYPNPSNGSVTIRTNSEATFFIMDIKGQIIQKGQIIHQLELNDMLPGLYIVKLTIDQKTETMRLLVE